MIIEYDIEKRIVTLYSFKKVNYYGTIPNVKKIKKSSYDKNKYYLYGNDDIVPLAILYGKLKINKIKKEG